MHTETFGNLVLVLNNMVLIFYSSKSFSIFCTSGFVFVFFHPEWDSNPRYFHRDTYMLTAKSKLCAYQGNAQSQTLLQIQFIIKYWAIV